jgi:drug/metabolite transporter (DMT)-like permease
VPAGEIVFFRSFFALFPLLVFMAWNGDLSSAYKTSRPGSHFARGLVGTTAMGLGFFALTRLPLPEAVTLNYAQPLLVVVFSALFLGETVRVYRWSAVAVGLVGVVIVSWPKLSLFGGGNIGGREFAGVMAAMAAASASAVAMLLIRNLVTTEKSSTIVFWFSTSASLFALLTPIRLDLAEPDAGGLAGYGRHLRRHRAGSHDRGLSLRRSLHRRAIRIQLADFESCHRLFGVWRCSDDPYDNRRRHRCRLRHFHRLA